MIDRAPVPSDSMQPTCPRLGSPGPDSSKAEASPTPATRVGGGVALSTALLSVLAAAGVGLVLPSQALAGGGTASFPTELVRLAESDTAWAAIQGRNVELILKDGSSMRGEVLSHDAESVVIALARDGSIRTVAKARIDDVRLMKAKSSERDDDDDDDGRDEHAGAYRHGHGMRATGVVFTTIGIVHLSLAGGVTVATGGEGYQVAIPFGASGATFLSIGIPLWGAGDAVLRSVKRKRRRGALPDGSTLHLGLLGGKERWEGRLTLRF